MTIGKESLYEKDNWLHGWTGGDVSFDVAIFKSLINNHYSFAENQAHIYLNKYGEKLSNWDKNRRQDAHDLSVKALFKLAEMMSTDKYVEQGKLEAYLRTIIERKALRFVTAKIKHDNHDDLEKLALVDDTEYQKEKRDLQDFMADCAEEIRESQIPFAVNNLNLLFKQKSEDKSIEELAEIEKTSSGGIKSRLRLARKMLQECIENKKKNDPSW